MLDTRLNFKAHVQYAAARVANALGSCQTKVDLVNLEGNF